MNNNLVLFGADIKTVESVNSKSGAVTKRLLSAKEYKDILRAKYPEMSSRQLKEEYNTYLRNSLTANTAGLAAAMTSGRLGVKGITTNEKTGAITIRAVDMDKAFKGADKKLSEIEAALANMSEEDLKSLLAKMQSMLPATPAVEV